jgi:hypothetical protein
MKHENISCAAGNAWALQPDRRYFKRCDTCGTFRVWANYYEVYYVDLGREETCWWWECTTCLIKTISDYAEVYQQDEPPTEMSATDIMKVEKEEATVRKLPSQRWVTQHALDGIYHMPWLPRHLAGTKPEWCEKCKGDND